MKHISSHNKNNSHFCGLGDTLNMNYPLCKLAYKTDWQVFESPKNEE